MAMERQPLTPIRRDIAFTGRNSAQLQPMIDAVYAVLAHTGVRVDSRRVLSILQEAGATVDGEKRVARLQPELIENALKHAPRLFTLGSRDGACDLELRPGVTYNCVGGTSPQVIDWRTRQQRSSTKADVADVARMQDYLGGVCFCGPTLAAGDCGKAALPHELHAAFLNTEKHVLGFVSGADQARLAVEMATVVAGDAGTLRERPVLSAGICPVSPLVYDGDVIEGALILAEAGVPVNFISEPSRGMTGPATWAGAFVLAAAEIVAGAVILQLAHPGAPVVGQSQPASSDPRNASLFFQTIAPPPLFTQAELVHAFGLPAFANFPPNDAPVDRGVGSWQAGMEVAVGAAFALFNPGELGTILGLSGTGMLFTPEGLILDHEIYLRTYTSLSEICMSDEALALEVIEAVGPGGNYLAEAHTASIGRTSSSPVWRA